MEQVKNILEVTGTIQCFGKTVRVSDGLIAPRRRTVHSRYAGSTMRRVVITVPAMAAPVEPTRLPTRQFVTVVSRDQWHSVAGDDGRPRRGLRASKDPE